MPRILFITIFIAAVTGCTSAPPPPPEKNYALETLQNDALQINRFIDNWSGFDQQYSHINNLNEYTEVKRKIRTSPEYFKFSGRAQFESKTNQFDAIVKRYEIWVDERAELLDEMDLFYKNYKDNQHRLVAANARPLSTGDYEIVVANAYYAMVPNDPDQAYASARYIGLKQLDIIAASRDQPLRLPTQHITDFVVEVRITNRSKDKILRPDGYISHQQSGNSRSGAFFLRSFREYLVSFSDDRHNTYQFKRAKGVINRDSEKGIRPGKSMTWTYRFSRDNHPLETVKKFQISFPERVFGRALKLTIPMKFIVKPNLPDSFQTNSP